MTVIIRIKISLLCMKTIVFSLKNCAINVAIVHSWNLGIALLIKTESKRESEKEREREREKERERKSPQL